MRGRERVAVGARARACALVRHPGREALVVGLDRHVQQLGQLVGEGPAQLGLLAFLPRRVVGKPTMTRSASSLATSSATASGSGGSTASSGRTRVPVGSEIAQPQRAVP